MDKSEYITDDSEHSLDDSDSAASSNEILSATDSIIEDSFEATTINSSQLDDSQIAVPKRRNVKAIESSDEDEIEQSHSEPTPPIADSSKDKSELSDEDEIEQLQSEPTASIVDSFKDKAEQISRTKKSSFTRQSPASLSPKQNAILSPQNHSRAGRLTFQPTLNSTLIGSLTPKRPPAAVVDFTTPRSAAIAVPSDSENSDDDDDDDDDNTAHTISDDDDDAPCTKMPVSLTKVETHSTSDQPSFIKVSARAYAEQKNKVRTIEDSLARNENMLRTLNIQVLPDKGQLLTMKTNMFRKNLAEETEKLRRMVVSSDIPDSGPVFTWDNLEAAIDAVQPETLGKKGIARYNAEKAMTMDRLKQLHGALADCPTEKDLAEDPKGLKVELMPHQKRALSWLMWRESQKPSGGILADDMGLGKTLTLISLILKINEINRDNDEEHSDGEEKQSKSDKYPGGTLIVCPASLINQWGAEITSKTKRGLLGFELYHGAKRETKSKRLARHDVVITTYAIAMHEFNGSGPLFRVRWRRIILDEAHQIRNHKSKTSEACCSLAARSRWALTGTPVHNKELDMYSLLKYLRCSPFDDLHVWKRWVADKSTGGQERLHAVISSVMLRRTKAELMELGSLRTLPAKEWNLVPITLDDEEMKVYQKVLLLSKTLFAQFLHQRAEKNQDTLDLQVNQFPKDPNSEYYKMREKLLKMNKISNVKQTDILVLLLRLRQICCHPSLITQMLQGDEELGTAEDHENVEDINLLDQLNRLGLEDEDEYTRNAPPNVGVDRIVGEESVGLKEASKGLLNPSNPVFAKHRPSTKIKSLIELFKKQVPKTDKAIIVSQWRSLLDLISPHLRDEGISFGQLDGTIPVPKRQPIVDAFNDPRNKMRVLLLSLTAGGVGLNLVGGNHLLLLDLHWNPQLENQAQDRIYRMGQTKPVFIYKFMSMGTIEERIKGLQDRKLQVAESMLTGSKQVFTNKLSLADLKMLFGF